MAYMCTWYTCTCMHTQNTPMHVLSFCPCPLPPVTCYSGYGSNYKGNVSVSLTNDSCLRWDSLDHTFNSPEVHPELQGAENYCRNPGMIGERPWCYTAEGWDYCNITHCDGRLIVFFVVSLFYFLSTCSMCICVFVYVRVCVCVISILL